MTFEDLTPDHEVTDALRRFDHAPAPSASQLRGLARRIVSSAAPLLEPRRANTVAWWDYPAVWARTLIPLGVTTALMAVACILWAALAQLPVAPQRVADAVPMRGVETENMVSQRVLFSLVAPLEQHVVPDAPRGAR